MFFQITTTYLKLYMLKYSHVLSNNHNKPCFSDHNNECIANHEREMKIAFAAQRYIIIIIKQLNILC